MAQRVLSYPFAPDPNTGTFKKVEQGTDLYKGQQVAAFIRTYRDERPVMPEFGTTDPTFDEFDAEAFAEKFQAFYGSTIALQNIEVVQSEGAVSQIHVTFE